MVKLSHRRTILTLAEPPLKGLERRIQAPGDDEVACATEYSFKVARPLVYFTE